MNIHESAENYLETILILSRTQPHVRSIDIANELGFSKPSVSVAMKNLRLNGYIETDSKGFISLTPAGMAIASSMYERHTFLSHLLMDIGVPEATALKDACRMEHVISAESFEALQKLHDTFHKDDPDWNKR